MAGLRAPRPGAARLESWGASLARGDAVTRATQRSPAACARTPVAGGLLECYVLLLAAVWRVSARSDVFRGGSPRAESRAALVLETSVCACHGSDPSTAGCR